MAGYGTGRYSGSLYGYGDSFQDATASALSESTVTASAGYLLFGAATVSGQSTAIFDAARIRTVLGAVSAVSVAAFNAALKWQDDPATSETWVADSATSKTWTDDAAASGSWSEVA